LAFARASASARKKFGRVLRRVRQTVFQRRRQAAQARQQAAGKHEACATEAQSTGANPTRASPLVTAFYVLDSRRFSLVVVLERSAPLDAPSPRVEHRAEQRGRCVRE
jgi:hypothetical protein